MHKHEHQSRSFISASRKTRKRGCYSSASSCSSSLVNGYRFKKAVLVSTPMWKQTPKYGGFEDDGVERPVSVRKLAATHWALNREVEVDGARSKEDRRRSGCGSSFPPHLSDPSHSPNSERMGVSRPGSVRRRMQTFAHTVSRNAAVESETRSRREASRGSSIGVRDRLKDLRNVLMTSKELLKIVDHIWGREEQSPSSVSLISAFHQELERGRLQVDRLLQVQECAGQMDVSRLIKQFAEEKAAWKVKEREVAEAAIQSIAGELEGEMKLRRQFENLNKKLGAELQALKGSLQKVTEELESERRTRKILEQVCDELAGYIPEDKAQSEHFKSNKALQEVENEREMLMKLSDAKNQSDEKNAAVVKLKRQIETLLKPHKTKGKAGGSSQSRLDRGNSAEIAKFLNSVRSGTGEGEMEESVGQVEDCADNIFQSNRSYMMTNWTADISRKHPMDDDDDDFGHRSISGGQRRSSRSSSIQKSMLTEYPHSYDHRRLDRNLVSGFQKRHQEHDSGDSMHLHKYPNMSRGSMYLNHPKDSPVRFVSPVRQWGQVRPPRDPHHAVSEMHAQAYSTGSKSRLSDARSETKSRRSYR